MIATWSVNGYELRAMARQRDKTGVDTRIPTICRTPAYVCDRAATQFTPWGDSPYRPDP